jgi:soluble lytic murein transglycosylase-like protein
MKKIGIALAAKGAAVFCAVAVLTLCASATELACLRNGFTIRHDHRQVLGENTRLYLGADDTSYVDVPTAEITGFEKDLSLPPDATPPLAPPPAAADLDQVVTSASATYHLDPDLVNSVIRAESGFNSRAVSRKGAQGLMQLMPGTAGKLGVTNPFDPEANVGGGTRYLRELLERYNFDLVKALAAYNAGPQRVEQYRGVPPYRETRAYVARIVRDYNRKKIAQEKQAAEERARQKRAQPPAAAAPASPSPR